MLVADGVKLSTIKSSAVTHVQGPCGFYAVGGVGWLRVKGTEPGAAWCAIQEWTLSSLRDKPETIRELVKASRSFPFIGKHVTDLTTGDITMAQEFAVAKGHNAVEIDINGRGRVDGCTAVDGKNLERECAGTVHGAAIGIDASPVEAQALLTFQVFTERFDFRGPL